ncbi:hypothetical protein L9F63_009183, partial [Diploptera punctata]
MSSEFDSSGEEYVPDSYCESSDDIINDKNRNTSAENGNIPVNVSSLCRPTKHTSMNDEVTNTDKETSSHKKEDIPNNNAFIRGLVQRKKINRSRRRDDLSIRKIHQSSKKLSMKILQANSSRVDEDDE